MIVLPFFVGAVIIIWEVLRYRRHGSHRFDFACGVSITFALSYSLAPIALNSIGPGHDSRAFWISLISYRDASVGIPAILLGLSGYISVMVAYCLTQRLKALRNLSSLSRASLLKLEQKDWLRIAVFFGLFAASCFFMYVEQRGARIATLLEYAAWIRWGIAVEGVHDASWTFLTWSMFSVPAALLFLGLSMEPSLSGRAERTRRRSSLAILGALVFFALSGTVLWMRAGRLHILNFVLVLLLFVWVRSRSALARLSTVLVALVFIMTITLYGKFWLAGSMGAAVPSHPLAQLQAISMEVAFPYLSLVNALSELNAYRWFKDYFLAPLLVVGVPIYRLVTGEPVPLRLLPEGLAAVNTRLVIDPSVPAAIPVDLVTLGYFSAGVVGVLVSCTLFGVVLGYLEMMLRPTTHPVLMLLRIFWIVFMSTIGVMYADPVNVLNDGLYVILPTVVAVFLGMTKLRGMTQTSASTVRIEKGGYINDQENTHPTRNPQLWPRRS